MGTIFITIMSVCCGAFPWKRSEPNFVCNKFSHEDKTVKILLDSVKYIYVRLGTPSMPIAVTNNRATTDFGLGESYWFYGHLLKYRCAIENYDKAHFQMRNFYAKRMTFNHFQS